MDISPTAQILRVSFDAQDYRQFSEAWPEFVGKNRGLGLPPSKFSASRFLGQHGEAMETCRAVTRTQGGKPLAHKTLMAPVAWALLTGRKVSDVIEEVDPDIAYAEGERTRLLSEQMVPIATLVPEGPVEERVKRFRAIADAALELAAVERRFGRHGAEAVA